MWPGGGGRCLPGDSRAERLAPVWSLMGVRAIFERAGLVECPRPPDNQAILHGFVEPEAGGEMEKVQGL
ncbi:hypothetical protein [Anaerolinea thermolimosa]|nr:hypothetical protein [Anaerolinea thermolimosa]